MNLFPQLPSNRSRSGRSTLLVSSLLAAALLPLSDAASQQGGQRAKRAVPSANAPGGGNNGGTGAVRPGARRVAPGAGTNIAPGGANTGTGRVAPGAAAPGAGTDIGAGGVRPGLGFAGSAPLSTIDVPLPPDLDTYIKDMDAAIALGKALFWDIQAGSDGQTACATCHYNGGADARAKNQMYDGHDEVFNIFESGRGGPNTTLESSDFPFHRLSNPNDAESQVLRSVDDVHASAGLPMRLFAGVTAGEGLEASVRKDDPVFSVAGCNVDQATNRNAPTVINSVFFVRSYWDGRADYRFNGVNRHGDLDPDARVLKTMPDGSVEEVRISIDKAALASQAVNPLTSSVEMAWQDDEDTGAIRSFSTVGRKLLSAAPLKLQSVHRRDMHLGHLSARPDRGLTPGLTYEQMIQDAFVDEWWNGAGDFGGFSMMERNFTLYWGLAIMLYEAQLVSDQAPIDFYMAGDESALTEQEKRGFGRFMSGGAGCADCHAGAEFAGGTWSDLEDALTGVRHGVERMGMVTGGQAALIGLTNIQTAENPTVLGHEEFWYADNLRMGQFIQVFRPDTGQVLVQANVPHTECALDEEGEPVEAEIEMHAGPGFPTTPFDPADPHPPGEFVLISQAFGELPNGECGMRVIIEGELVFGTNTPAGLYPVHVNGQHVADIVLGESEPDAVYDAGFYNIGVRPTEEDLGIGADGPFGPLSFTKRIQNGETSAKVFDLEDPVQTDEYAAVNGAFKASSLRNIVLSAPYMHNGSMATLEQVVQFYARGADFLEQNIPDTDPGVDGVGGLRNKADEQAAMVAFLSNALLDPRVLNDSGPFSHPSLPRRLGHQGNETSVVDADGDGVADPISHEIRATGVNGGREAVVFIDQLEPGVHVSIDPGESLFPVKETSYPGDLLFVHEDGSEGCGLLGQAFDSVREVRISLTKAPTANVRVRWRISDATELGVLEVDEVTGETSVLDRGALVFRPSDWFHPQVLMLTGVQDGENDGNTAATLSFLPFISNDSDYEGWALEPMYFTVEDTTSVAGVMHVSAAADPSFGNGTEEHPFATIGEALSCGSGVGRVLVHAGTYYEDLVIQNGSVQIEAAAGAILQGSGQRPAIEVRENTLGSSISGLTITGGAGETGGVLVTNGGDLTLTGCTITGCTGGTAGGMLVRNQATASVVGCTFDGNVSNNGPGGLMIEHSQALVSNCTFENNSGREGGALTVRNQGVPTIQDSTFLNNSAHQGGAVFLDGGSVTLMGCVLSGNSAAATGGAVFARNQVVVSLDRTKVTNNTAPSGGGVSMDNGVLDAVSSTLATNGESIFIMNTGSVSLNSSILWDGGTGTSIGFANPGNTNGFLGEAEFSIVDSAAVDGLSSDPMFKDADVGDHRLVVGSPGIDSGDPALGLDPDGSAPDMGSHMYLGR